MNFAALGHALDRLRVPGKIVHLMLMTYRYIAVIALEYERLVRAAKIRGFRPGTNLHTYKTYAYFIAMLFIRAASRAERVNRAMRCRGFDGRFYSLSVFPSNPRNWVFALSMAAVILLLVFIEWGDILGLPLMRV
jgi:cobalt/nickel transport system permease protein